MEESALQAQAFLSVRESWLSNQPYHIDDLVTCLEVSLPLIAKQNAE